MKKLHAEIYLPISRNDGGEFPQELYLDLAEELCARFGGLSSRDGMITGSWLHEGRLYRDQLRSYFVLMDDRDENWRYLSKLKDDLKLRFEQLDLLIEVIRVEWV